MDHTRQQDEVVAVRRQRSCSRAPVDELDLAVDFVVGKARRKIGAALARSFRDRRVGKISSRRAVAPTGARRIGRKDACPPTGTRLHFENARAGLQTPELQVLDRLARGIARLLIG